jgi:hypothetical protein
MKKQASAVFISVILFSAVAGTRFVSLGKANFIPQAYTEMTIENPDNMTYNLSTITLNFSAETNRMIYDFFYNLDEQDMERIGMSIISQELENPAHNPQIYRVALKGSCVLSDLSEGLHSVSFYHIRLYSGEDPKNGEVLSSATVDFIIDTVPPEVSVSSLENKTYYSSDVELDFTVNELASQISFSLDGQENVTANGNTTLSGLSCGAHNLTVYAWDAAGNIGASETIYFTVTEPFPTVLILATSGASIAIIGIVLLVYFKKRRK